MHKLVMEMSLYLFLMKYSMKKVFLFCVLCSVSMFIGCTDSTNNTITPMSYPQQATVNKRVVMSTTPNGVKVFNGGYGSSITSNAEGIYYIMTDRGPNIDGSASGVKVFSNPVFISLITFACVAPLWCAL